VLSVLPPMSFSLKKLIYIKNFKLERYLTPYILTTKNIKTLNDMCGVLQTMQSSKETVISSNEYKIKASAKKKIDQSSVYVISPHHKYKRIYHTTNHFIKVFKESLISKHYGKNVNVLLGDVVAGVYEALKLTWVEEIMISQQLSEIGMRMLNLIEATIKD